jgi:hypothetical protein
MAPPVSLSPDLVQERINRLRSMVTNFSAADLPPDLRGGLDLVPEPQVQNEPEYPHPLFESVSASPELDQIILDERHEFDATTSFGLSQDYRLASSSVSDFDVLRKVEAAELPPPPNVSRYVGQTVVVLNENKVNFESHEEASDACERSSLIDALFAAKVPFVLSVEQFESLFCVDIYVNPGWPMLQKGFKAEVITFLIGFLRDQVGRNTANPGHNTPHLVTRFNDDQISLAHRQIQALELQPDTTQHLIQKLSSLNVLGGSIVVGSADALPMPLCAAISPAIVPIVMREDFGMLSFAASEFVPSTTDRLIQEFSRFLEARAAEFANRSHKFMPARL